MRNSQRNSIYDVWHRENLSSPERAAILAMDSLGGVPMTYAEMDTQIHALGVAFNKFCGAEEVISHCGLTTIDSVLTLFAANAVGKKTNCVPYGSIIEDPAGYVEATGTKTLIVLDILYPKIAQALAKIKLDRVVISSLSDYALQPVSDGLPEQLKAALRGGIYEKIRAAAQTDVGYEILSWKEFMQAGEGKRLSEAELQKNCR